MPKYPPMRVPFQVLDKSMTDLQETETMGTVLPFTADTAVLLSEDDYRMFWHEHAPDYPFMQQLPANCLDPITGRLHGIAILDCTDPGCILLSRMDGKYYAASLDDIRQLELSDTIWQYRSLSITPPTKADPGQER